MGGLSGGGGLSDAQMQQLQQMLTATKAPPSIFDPVKALSAAQQKNYATLTGFVKAGTKLNATQTATLDRYKGLIAKTGAANRAKALLISLGGAKGQPTRSSATDLAQDARMTLLQRRGYKDTVKTSGIGDPGFGTSLSKPTLTGQTA